MPAAPSAPENTSTCRGVMLPRAVARRDVRSMRASISRSIRQFTAKAAAASSQMPNVPATTIPGSGSPGVARNMPITAQNTASCVTRGFVSTRYCRSRLCGCRLSVVMGNSLLGNVIQARTYRCACQDQACRATVMQHGNQQRPFKEDRGEAREELRHEQRQDQACGPAQGGGAPQRQWQAAQPYEDQQGKVAMYPVDAGQSVLGNDFARRQFAQATDQREAAGQIHDGHPAAMAGRE